ncbi:hypothetical protein BV378_19025 [Nostoc sp. RF31YmG]|nr:hypothetical protein BV378_19025 [Nostoc sp. RF31YmG]OUL29997.1 hypothetical protein BV375_14610 [Nostoc sp. 106C]
MFQGSSVNPIQNGDNKILDDVKALGTIAATAGAAGTGSLAVATITSSAPGILGVLGFTTTTVVILPVAGVVAAAGLVGYGIYKDVQAAQSHK